MTTSTLSTEVTFIERLNAGTDDEPRYILHCSNEMYYHTSVEVAKRITNELVVETSTRLPLTLSLEGFQVTDYKHNLPKKTCF